MAAFHKVFKRVLLSLCQAEFEKADDEAEQEERLAHAENKSAAEREYELNLMRKHYIGLMQFIGE